jgi:hypothetical protein
MLLLCNEARARRVQKVSKRQLDSHGVQSKPLSLEYIADRCAHPNFTAPIFESASAKSVFGGTGWSWMSHSAATLFAPSERAGCRVLSQPPHSSRVNAGTLIQSSSTIAQPRAADPVPALRWPAPFERSDPPHTRRRRRARRSFEWNSVVAEAGITREDRRLHKCDDGELARALQAQPRIEDPARQAVVWPRSPPPASCTPHVDDPAGSGPRRAMPGCLLGDRGPRPRPCESGGGGGGGSCGASSAGRAPSGFG